MLSLEPYKLQLEPAPARVREAIRQGVKDSAVVPSSKAAQLLGGAQPPVDGAFRDAEGHLLVTCVTDMPGLTPAMIDW